MKKLFTIFIILLLVLIVGLAGDLDHDEYIEANLTPKVKILNY
jgi:hypothetical protein